MNPKAQQRRYGIDEAQAIAVEEYRRRLYAEALTPQGTEARKQVKRLMTHRYKPEVISSNDFSESKNMRKTSAKSNQGNVRAIGNKTDVKVNSYWSSKRGDNLPAEHRMK